MIGAALVSLVLPLVQPSQQAPPEPEFGWVEFSRAPSMRGSFSIKVYVVLDDKNRVRYLDEIGSSNSRTLMVRAPVGTSKFIVILEPGGGVSSGARSDVVRRTRPNVTVEVEPGMATPVQIGGFTDFQRSPSQGDTSGLGFVQRPNDPEASQFRTQITVGEPREVKQTER
jgi:hypothetical protein